jgi:tRNA dimethylallyltransferase
LKWLLLQAQPDAAFAQFSRTQIEFEDSKACDLTSRRRHDHECSIASNTQLIETLVRPAAALQYPRGRFRATRRSSAQARPSRRLCVGDDWLAGDRRSPISRHSDSLLASHPLEPALTVAQGDHKIANKIAETAGWLVTPEPLLVVILGPTASGKTALSLTLAERFHGEIVNCDSVAVYRELEIGTAKPNGAERARAPHHLLDIVDPNESMTAGEYARQARQALAEISARRKLPIVVGGTGLYFRALLDGLFPGPLRSEELRERLRERAAAKGSAHLHRILRRLDPAAAEKIHANDASKLIRAVEVCVSSRQKMSELWQRGRDPLQGFRILRLGLDPDRAALYERINERAQCMFEAGLIEETKQLIQKYGDTARPLASLGYKQAAQLLRGDLTREQAVQAAQQGHRNYAKRQMTWFRREPDVIWLEGFGDDPAIGQAAVAQIEKFVSADSR